MLGLITYFVGFFLYLFQPLNIDVPRESLTNGTGRFSTGVLVTATLPVSVYGFNDISGGCGGFLVIPVESLGHYYHGITWWPPHELTQIGVVATEEETEVTIILPKSSGILSVSSELSVFKFLMFFTFLFHLNGCHHISSAICPCKLLEHSNYSAYYG